MEMGVPIFRVPGSIGRDPTRYPQEMFPEGPDLMSGGVTDKVATPRGIRAKNLALPESLPMRVLARIPALIRVRFS